MNGLRDLVMVGIALVVGLAGSVGGSDTRPHHRGLCSGTKPRERGANRSTAKHDSGERHVY